MTGKPAFMLFFAFITLTLAFPATAGHRKADRPEPEATPSPIALADVRLPHVPVARALALADLRITLPPACANCASEPGLAVFSAVPGGGMRLSGRPVGTFGAADHPTAAAFPDPTFREIVGALASLPSGPPPRLLVVLDGRSVDSFILYLLTGGFRAAGVREVYLGVTADTVIDTPYAPAVPIGRQAIFGGLDPEGIGAFFLPASGGDPSTGWHPCPAGPAGTPRCASLADYDLPAYSALLDELHRDHPDAGMVIGLPGGASLDVVALLLSTVQHAGKAPRIDSVAIAPGPGFDPNTSLPLSAVLPEPLVTPAQRIDATSTVPVLRILLDGP